MFKKWKYVMILDFYIIKIIDNCVVKDNCLKKV